MDGYKPLFQDKEDHYIENFDFSNFRERKDIYSFVLGEGPLDWLNFSYAYHQDRILFAKYIGVPKSDLGYGEKFEWTHIDALDSTYIFFNIYFFLL